jgi:hypothetical protein
MAKPNSFPLASMILAFAVGVTTLMVIDKALAASKTP